MESSSSCSRAAAPGRSSTRPSYSWTSCNSMTDRAPAAVARVVALGASNLTLGFQNVVATARTAWGPGVEVVAALGHGRSYGANSTVVIRTLPGILQSGLWRKLESLPAATTRGL